MIITPETVRPGSVLIFLDDVDITSACFYAEAPDQPGLEILGKVKVFEFDKGGVPAKTVEKIGNVRWEPEAP